MTRSPLILSCAIHGSVLAIFGWATLHSPPRPDAGRAGISVSLSPGDEALIADAPRAPEIAAPPAEVSFTPPAPELPAVPLPEPAVESTPPSPPPVMLATTSIPPALPDLPATKKKHGARAGGSLHRAGATAGGGFVSNSGGNNGGGSGYLPPQYLLRLKPPYPPAARAARVEGLVLLLVAVDASGHVTQASVRKSSGRTDFDSAALEAIHTWRFTPARQGEQAISATVEVPIRFSLAA
jgi:protein TonB